MNGYGKKRRFPSLSTAMKLYGDRIFYKKPYYEKENQCPWCGGEVNNKRRRFCSNECSQAFAGITVWNRTRDSYSLRILYRDNFTCQDCGEFHAFVNEHGMTIPIDDCHLEVHHIVPVSCGGGDEPENLITLCKTCHAERHRKLRNGEEIWVNCSKPDTAAPTYENESENNLRQKWKQFAEKQEDKKLLELFSEDV